MRDPMRKVVQVHSARTHRKEDGKMLIEFHVMSRLECGHDVNGYGPQERACPECGEEAKRCTWTYDETHFAWDSSCGAKWILMDGGPNENEIRFCHGCGKPVEIACEATPENRNCKEVQP